VYSSTLKIVRRELHRKAAAWFADAEPVLRAEHLDLVETGARLIASRLTYLKEIEGFLQEFYGAIAGSGATAGTRLGGNAGQKRNVVGGEQAAVLSAAATLATGGSESDQFPGAGDELLSTEPFQ